MAVLAVTGTRAIAAGSHFGVTISTDATRNVTYSDGVFKATADHAILNVRDLESALKKGDIEVTTGSGSGGDEMGDLHLNAAVTWSSASRLALVAYHSIFVEYVLKDGGSGSLSLTTNHGGHRGVMTYGSGGRVTFANLSNVLTINGSQYTLVPDIDTLANDIAANPAGLFALAAPYDAKPHGSWNASPVATAFSGTFDGLGNAIKNFKIYARYPQSDVALFSTLQGGAMNHVRLVSANLHVKGGPNASFSVAMLVGTASGTLFEDSVTGTISGSNKYQQEINAAGLVGTNYADITAANADVDITWNNVGIGGLVGDNFGTITQSQAQGAITGAGFTLLGGLTAYNDRSGIITLSNSSTNIALAGGDRGGAQNGGLVGENQGIIDQCFATGNVSGGDVGGLVGVYAGSTITNSYATGAVSGDAKARAAGGLIGAAQSGGTIEDVYSTGFVSSGNQATYLGGLVGDDYDDTQVFTDAYWDTDTSGITNPSQGAGTPPNDPGITGLTSKKLQSGLPAGFSAKIWAEDPSINNGFPYLIANPPQ